MGVPAFVSVDGSGWCWGNWGSLKCWWSVGERERGSERDIQTDSASFGSKTVTVTQLSGIAVPCIYPLRLQGSKWLLYARGSFEKNNLQLQASFESSPVNTKTVPLERLNISSNRENHCVRLKGHTHTHAHTHTHTHAHTYLPTISSDIPIGVLLCVS